VNPARQDDTTFFAARGFGKKLGFGTNPAVVVVDLINAFTDPESPLGAAMDDEVAAADTVLGAARRAHAPIFFTTLWYDEPDMADAGLWAAKMGGLAVLGANTPAVEVDKRLAPRPHEAVVMKKYASVFFGTDLASRLNARRVDTVLLVGCTTSGCVRASAVDAIQLGFRPMVVREAVADRSAAAHAQSLFDLEQKYADVVSVEECVRYLGDLR
jgi:nicotinamidase-related amidase